MQAQTTEEEASKTPISRAPCSSVVSSSLPSAGIQLIQPGSGVRNHFLYYHKRSQKRLTSKAMTATLKHKIMMANTMQFVLNASLRFQENCFCDFSSSKSLAG
eukprot:1425923-Amphidinium_carterae.1